MKVRERNRQRYIRKTGKRVDGRVAGIALESKGKTVGEKGHKRWRDIDHKR